MKKLLITTALTASLISGAALADTKFGGNVETTYTTGNTGTTTKGEGFGTDIEITVDHTKSLDNGWDLAVRMAVDESGETNVASADVGANQNGLSVSRSGIQLSNKDMGLTISVGTEMLQIGENYIVPAVGDVIGDIGASGANAHYLDSINDTHNLAVAYNTGYGTLQVGATPARRANKDTGDSVASKETVDEGSAVEGSFGTKLADGAIELFVAAAQGKAQEHKGDLVNAGKTNFSERFVGASYNFGKGKVGVTRREFSAGQAGSTATDGTLKTTMIAAAFNLTDQVSVGFQDQTTEGDSYTNDEEGQVISIGYNFGGVTFTAAKVTLDSDGGSAGSDNDYLRVRH
jgi:hypothetical protein